MEVMAISMFKLGEYYEDEARDIVDWLKDAGMKVDIRIFTSSQLEVFPYLEGRMSEIKEELEEEKFNKYAQYLVALRKVLAEGATSENFSEMFQLEIDPQIHEKRRQLSENIGGILSEEELEIKRQESTGLIDDLLEMSNAEAFADMTLERNRIKIGEEVGSRLDDPIMRIFADNIDEDESKLAKTTTVFTIEPQAEVYVDEFSALFSEEIDEDFRDEYPNDYMRLVFLGKLISNLTEPSPGKIDMKAFSKRCEFQLENNGDLLELNGRSAAEELARSLEKNDIIKVKGDSIKWKH
jgi:hypothetical protein